MDTDNSLNVQNAFFNQLRKDRTRISVLLNNGQRVNGVVKSFDRFTFLLETKQGEQIVFKHAVSTVAPFRPEAARQEKRAPGAGPQEKREKHEKKGFGNYISFEPKKG